ncbi:hypothetical protein IWX49DRAFT_22021 [Phyllosticta citricarpa]|uniref:Uncharacterized protein n=1 Tax=Phyllosticta paracitricarpa TaxID=2016321 RepID=A0ABR1MZ59_9PEZI
MEQQLIKQASRVLAPRRLELLFLLSLVVSCSFALVYSQHVDFFLLIFALCFLYSLLLLLLFTMNAIRRWMNRVSLTQRGTCFSSLFTFYLLLRLLLCTVRACVLLEIDGMGWGRTGLGFQTVSVFVVSFGMVCVVGLGLGWVGLLGIRYMDGLVGRGLFSFFPFFPYLSSHWYGQVLQARRQN